MKLHRSVVIIVCFFASTFFGMGKGIEVAQETLECQDEYFQQRGMPFTVQSRVSTIKNQELSRNKGSLVAQMCCFGCAGCLVGCCCPFCCTGLLIAIKKYYL